MQYEVVLVQTKAIVVDVKANSADDAIYKAKQAANFAPKYNFNIRTGKICVAGVRELE